ncbi:MAG: hypothetical protein LYZ70_07880, partial [Nitrososphaerales archaeon]|nr:hypothetical protein [Nitrososphaerales archaeon]
MRASVIFVALLVFSAPAFAFVTLHQSTSDPCDSYGDCVSSSITYTRANPDGSLYLGDQFTISLQVTPGAGAISCGNGCSQSWSGALSEVAWSYDTSALRSSSMGETAAQFTSIANATGSYTVTATASFLVTITTCVTTTSPSGSSTTCSSSVVQTSVPISQQVSLRAFILVFQTKLVNATTPLHQLRRNPDGTFYPFDAFYVNYTYSFLFMQQRPDIKVYAAPSYDHSVLSLTSYKNSTSTGYFFFQLDNRTGSYSVTTTAKAFNWLNQLLGQ